MSTHHEYAGAQQEKGTRIGRIEKHDWGRQEMRTLKISGEEWGRRRQRMKRLEGEEEKMNP